MIRLFTIIFKFLLKIFVRNTSRIKTRYLSKLFLSRNIPINVNIKCKNVEIVHEKDANQRHNDCAWQRNFI